MIKSKKNVSALQDSMRPRSGRGLGVGVAVGLAWRSTTAIYRSFLA